MDERNIYSVTTKFPQIHSDMKNQIKYVEKSYYRLYTYIVKHLDNNYSRHIYKMIRTSDFIDFPNSKKTNKIPDPPITPHYHSIFMVHQSHISKFEDLVLDDKTFFAKFRKTPHETLLNSLEDCLVKPIWDLSVPNLHSKLRYVSKFIRPMDVQIQELIDTYNSPNDLRASIRGAYENRLETLGDQSIPSVSHFPHTTTKRRHSRRNLLPPGIRERNQLIKEGPQYAH
jgi:hypothetical protein